MARLFHVLQTTAHAAKRAGDACVLEVAGVTVAQAAALAVIAEGATPSAVAKALDVTEPAVTSMVTRLVEAGLVERRTSETDGRVRILRLTAAGSDAHDRAEDAFRAFMRRIEDELDAPRLEGLESGLRDLRTALSTIATEEEPPP